MCVCVCVCVCIASEIDGLASQFATQNFLVSYSKLNLGSKFQAEFASHLPHIKLRTIYIYNFILYYNNCFSMATNCDPIHDLSSNFY